MMRKFVSLIFLLGILGLVASPLYAGGIINKQNQSADYMRTLNRHAATDYADIAVYNPAGIMQMDGGGYAKLDVMYFDKDYSNTIPDNYGEFNQSFGKLDQDEPSVIPGAFAVYKQDKWAGFFAFTIPAGGGELKYDNGSARTTAIANNLAEGANALLPGTTFDYTQIDYQFINVKESSVYGFTLGGSFALNDLWSFAAGVRYATGTREFEGGGQISATTPAPSPPFPPGANAPREFNLNIEQEADGWCGVLGVNFAPNEKLNAAMTFYTKTKLKYENDVKQDTILNTPSGPVSLAAQLGFGDGTKKQIDIPGLLGLGVSYKFTPQLKVDLNYVYYFEKSASIDTYSDEGDSWDLGVSAEYAFSPQWKASLGYLLTDIKLDDDQQIFEAEEPKLSANSLAAGVVWSPVPTWAITLGGAYVMYDSVTDTSGIEYEKKVWNVSIGAQWKFF